MNKLALATALIATVSIAPSSAHADYVVAPNSSANTPGSQANFFPFGNGSDGATVQFIVAASQLVSLAPGSQISSIGFRLNGSQLTINEDLNYTQFDIQIGSSSRKFDDQSATFSSNFGSDSLLARSGTLTLPGKTLIGNFSGANPFFDIAFAQNYAYKGGDLLVTIRSSLTSRLVGVDAIGADGTAVRTVSAFGTGATTGIVGFFTVPIIRFGTADVPSAVPEPATWAMMLVGFGMVGATARYRRRSAKVAYA